MKLLETVRAEGNNFVLKVCKVCRMEQLFQNEKEENVGHDQNRYEKL